MSNKIFCALPLYGPVSPIFVKHWILFSQQLGRAKARVHVLEMGYVDAAETFAADTALTCTCGHGYTAHRVACQPSHRAGRKCSDPAGMCRDYINDPPKRPKRCTCKRWVAREYWDYLCWVESDNLIPDGWLDRVQTYDPKDHPIVGLIYFGKNAEDQRPIPGTVIKKGTRKGDFIRLDGDQLGEMGVGLEADDARRGFYKVDVVGMGATAVHRDVYLNWPHDKLPWYQTLHVAPGGFMGQDVWFCKMAQELGFSVEVDTTLTAGHIGPWISTEASYSRSQWYVRELAKREMIEAAP